MAKAEKLSKDEVLRLARLARLELSEDEVKQYTYQLGEILAYVGKLQGLGVVAKKSAAAEPVTLRTDDVAPWPEPERLIKQAPRTRDNFIEVPAVFGDRE